MIQPSTTDAEKELREVLAQELVKVGLPSWALAVRGYSNYQWIYAALAAMRRLRPVYEPTPEVTEAMVERGAKALCARHYADRFGKAPDVDHVRANVAGNWHRFKDDARDALHSALSTVPGGGGENDDCQTCDGHRQIVDTRTPDESGPAVIACPNCSTPPKGMGDEELLEILVAIEARRANTDGPQRDDWQRGYATACREIRNMFPAALREASIRAQGK